MTIKVISFDLDDTFWPIMPTILNAEKVTNKWIKENYPGVGSLLGSKDVLEIRNKLLKKDPGLMYQLSKLRELSFIELGVLAGYSEKRLKKWQVVLLKYSLEKEIMCSYMQVSKSVWIA